MATETSLLPLRSQPEYETSPVTVPLRRAGRVFDAMSSETARQIVTALNQEPMAISGIAEAVGTSMQNARYHTSKLQDAGVVTEVDTWYSEKGREMSVYVASCREIVLTLGEDAPTPG